MRLVPAAQAESRAVPVRVPSMPVTIETPPARILDFDLETLAAGYADPNWVPSKIMVASWSWVGEEGITTCIATPEGFFHPEVRRERVLVPLLEAISQADMVTGHNLLRFDLPTLNAECLRCNLPPMEPVLVEDTIRFTRTKGFKKGLDNISELLDVPIKKQAMSWQEWEQAYEEDGWKTAISRCESDVLMHKQLREKMRDLGWLKPPLKWRP